MGGACHTSQQPSFTTRERAGGEGRGWGGCAEGAAAAAGPLLQLRAAPALGKPAHPFHGLPPLSPPRPTTRSRLAVLELALRQSGGEAAKRAADVAQRAAGEGSNVGIVKVGGWGCGSAKDLRLGRLLPYQLPNPCRGRGGLGARRAGGGSLLRWQSAATPPPPPGPAPRRASPRCPPHHPCRAAAGGGARGRGLHRPPGAPGRRGLCAGGAQGHAARGEEAAGAALRQAARRGRGSRGGGGCVVQEGGLGWARLLPGLARFPSGAAACCRSDALHHALVAQPRLSPANQAHAPPTHAAEEPVRWVRLDPAGELLADIRLLQVRGGVGGWGGAGGARRSERVRGQQPPVSFEAGHSIVQWAGLVHTAPPSRQSCHTNHSLPHRSPCLP